MTVCLEGRCSIQLSYATIQSQYYFFHKNSKKVGVAGFEPATSCSQSRRDNRATLHPENKILIIINSIIVNDAERQGFEPWQRLPVDRLAICSITTLAPLLVCFKELIFGLQMYYMQYNIANLFSNFL